MKKRHLLLGLAFMLAASTVKAQFYQQGQLSLNQESSANHDSTICGSTGFMDFNVTVTNATAVDTIFLVDETFGTLASATANTTGSNPTWNVVIPVPMYNNFVPDYQVSGGTAFFSGSNMKVIHGTDTIYNIQDYIFLNVTNPCTYGMLDGHVFLDNNTNCLYDSLTDGPLVTIPVTANETLYSPSMTSNTQYAYTDVNGYYTSLIQQSWLTSYTVSLPPNYQFIFPASSCGYQYTFTAAQQSNILFPLTCSANVDVQCNALAPANVRPNTPFYMFPYVSNIGCTPESGTVTLTLDNNVTYDPSMSTNPATTVSGNVLSWDYNNLNSISSGGYWNSFFSSIHLTPNASVLAGDSLCFNIQTAAPTGDIDATNNNVSFCIPVVASFDPNEKEVAPKGTGPQGVVPMSTDELTYTIHFQNTGTSYAMNVHVVDTLDANIVPGSIKILGTSGVMSPVWLAPNVVSFNYDYIYLPDSGSNEIGSHGDVRFSVKLASGLPQGTHIRNTANIYFDTNPAVVTNTTINTLGAATGVSTVSGAPGLVNIYPNPAGDNINIEASVANGLRNGQLTVSNISGQVMMQQNIKADKTELNISQLPGGMYIMKITSDNGTTTRKFTKE